jgi:hypothetical protein
VRGRLTCGTMMPPQAGGVHSITGAVGAGADADAPRLSANVGRRTNRKNTKTKNRLRLEPGATAETSTPEGAVDDVSLAERVVEMACDFWEVQTMEPRNPGLRVDSSGAGEQRQHAEACSNSATKTSVWIRFSSHHVFSRRM